jgi:signal transduction histidine kinase
MSETLLTVEISREPDVAFVRQRTRRLAELLGVGARDRTGLATAVSEIARNAFEYAGGGRAEFFVDDVREPELVVRIADRGPGIADVRAILEGRYRSPTGLGLGIVGAKRLTDRFEMASAHGEGTSVTLAKRLPASAPTRGPRLASVLSALAAETSDDPYIDVQLQNQQLMRAMAELRDRHADVERLNRELEETNRGVLALYSEVDERTVYLARINELKTRFLSELSHELRTPLNAIRNVSRFLMDGYEGDVTDGQRRGLTMIDNAASTLSAFVDDWLDLAKIEAGRIEIHVSEFAVEELFSALRGVFRPLAVFGTVDLQFQIDGDIQLLHTDEAKVSQVLRNFISNALKFTEHGEVSVTARRDGEDVVFDVADTGIGIAPEDAERIFEEFTQVQSPVQRRVRGTGLGLPLSRKLARLMGGDISLEARAGGGSIFRLRIPVCLNTAHADLESTEREGSVAHA